MNADPEVMHDLGGPLTRAQSDQKLQAYAESFEQHGYSRWVIESIDGQGPHGGFIGYAGVVARPDPSHPLGAHDEIGWRLTRRSWGKGYATEAARAALDDVFNRCKLDEVLSYTSADNHRSQAVMERLHLVRDQERDFTADYDGFGLWTGLVWTTSRPA